jgi:hypothetical protein
MDKLKKRNVRKCWLNATEIDCIEKLGNTSNNAAAQRKRLL